MFAQPLQANVSLLPDRAEILFFTPYRVVCVMDALNLSPRLVFVGPQARVSNRKVSNPEVANPIV